MCDLLVRIVKTTAGKSRQFGFVGFRSEQQARESQQYFNNTFLQSSRIQVEMAAKFGDSSLEAKSKYSKGNKKTDNRNNATSAQENMSKSAAVANAKPQESVIPSTSNKVEGKGKSEFIAVMKSRGKGQFWANDIESPPPSAEHAGQTEADGSVTYSDTNDDFPEDADTDYSSDESEAVELPTKTGTMSDLDYLKAKVSSNLSSSDSDDDKMDGDGEANTERPTKNKKTSLQFVKPRKSSIKSVDISHEEEQIKGNDEVMGNNDADELDESRLFVRNLPFSCSEEEISELFKVYGPITHVHIPLSNTGDGRGKGFGFVQYMIPEHASKAMAALDGTPFQGRLLHIIQANKAVEKTSEDIATEGSGPRLSAYQQKKEEKRRKLATLKEGWNAAHIRSDTVLDATAAKYVHNVMFVFYIMFEYYFKGMECQTRIFWTPQGLAVEI
jgi:multiple RNA-binding domain-containing protein 1